MRSGEGTGGPVLYVPRRVCLGTGGPIYNTLTSDLVLFRHLFVNCFLMAMAMAIFFLGFFISNGNFLALAFSFCTHGNGNLTCNVGSLFIYLAMAFFGIINILVPGHFFKIILGKFIFQHGHSLYFGTFMVIHFIMVIHFESTFENFRILIHVRLFQFFNFILFWNFQTFCSGLGPRHFFENF